MFRILYLRIPVLYPRMRLDLPLLKKLDQNRELYPQTLHHRV
jgi:hypothetical protein